MRKIFFISLWVLIFSIGWENLVLVSKIGTISHALGLGTFFIAILAYCFYPLLRRPSIIHVLIICYLGWNAISFLWSNYPAISLRTLITQIQLFVLIWLIWQASQDNKSIIILEQAYITGLLISIVSLFICYFKGVQSVYLRYSAVGFNANDIAVAIALGIPLSWFLFLKFDKLILKIINLIVLLCSLAAIILTGSRTGMIVGSIGFCYLLITFFNTNKIEKVITILILLSCLAIIIFFINSATFQRILSVKSELLHGTWGGRIIIWKMGIKQWFAHPLLGIGIGCYKQAVKWQGLLAASHNTFLQILVETGIIGFLLFMNINFLLFKKIVLLPSIEKKLFIIIFIIIFLGLSVLSWGLRKQLWIMYAFMLGHIYNQKSQKID